jgi:AraC-like DNA-binding protein
MAIERSGLAVEGLERSCEGPSRDWIWHRVAGDGVELLQAWFQGRGYRTHRHDTYAIGLTDAGVQAFDYRGAAHVSLPGQVVILHPDEPHDGRAGTAAGFGYRLVYVDPASIAEAIRALTGRGQPLPFAPEPVAISPTLSGAIREVFQAGNEPLALDDLVGHLAAGLLAADPGSGELPRERRLDVVAVERARQVLDAAQTRVVRSWELEAETGLSRYELARHFRAVLGTSPYRYLLMRRLVAARAQMAQPRPLVEIALEAGFADQAHFTRMFTAAFGITPARYAALAARRGVDKSVWRSR